MTNTRAETKRRFLLLAALLAGLFLVLALGCDDEGEGGGGGDTDTDTDTTPDTDSWVDAYTMPFDVEPFQWANVPGGLDAPTVETFAGKVLLILFFQRW